MICLTSSLAAATIRRRAARAMQCIAAFPGVADIAVPAGGAAIRGRSASSTEMGHAALIVPGGSTGIGARDLWIVAAI
jgi:hypothetical protein